LTDSFGGDSFWGLGDFQLLSTRSVPADEERIMPLAHAQDQTQEAPQEVAPEEQRRSLGELLQGLDFARATAALQPSGEGSEGQTASALPSADPAILARFGQVAPAALSQVDAEDGKTSDAPAGAPAAPEERSAEAEAGADPAAELQAEAAMEADAAADDGPGPESLDASDQVAEGAGGPALAGGLGRSGAGAPVQRKASPGRARAAQRGGLPLNYKQARAALRWTRRRPTANQPFTIRRYQRVIGMPADGRLTFAFVQQVARFQQRLGARPNGRLAGRTMRAARKILRTRFKADRRLLLTRIELKQARTYNRQLIRSRTLKRQSVKEIQRLIGHVTRPPGAFTDGFMRALAAFQREHGLTPHGGFTRQTVQKVREIHAPRWVAPSQAPISSKFGMRLHPIHGGWRMHTGVDFAAGQGAPILAARGGVVTGAAMVGGYGNMVTISHGEGYTSRYAHCSAMYVKVGQRVTAGERIAAVGSTGDSTGPHLHFEILKNGAFVDPEAYL